MWGTGWWVRELKVVQKHKQACGREQGPLWRSGGPSSLTPACAPQSPARRPCLSSLTPACTPQSPARRSCLCLQGWVVWGVDPDVEAGPCESCPPSAFGSSGSPGLSLGPGHPVCAQGLPPDFRVWVSGVSSSWKRQVVLEEGVCSRQGTGRWERTRANVWLL